MVKPCVVLLAVVAMHGAFASAGVTAHGVSLKTDPEPFPAWRAAAAALVARGDADALATAAALTFAGAASRSTTASATAAAALDLALKASELAPDRPAIGWVRLQLCADVPACDFRQAATTMRWIDPENGAAWLPTLGVAEKERDTMEVDRILAGMAQGTRFDVYGNRTTVLMYDALNSVRTADHLKSDLKRLTVALEIAGTAAVPSYSALINACREAATSERRQACLRLSKTMQRADAVMAQLVGFAMQKRLTSDAKELRTIAERRHLLEWRVSAANRSDTPLLPWLRNARARSRIAQMRAMPREEDVYIAILREHKMPLGPAEEHR